jgi:UMF1 family MFS transporter
MYDFANSSYTTLISTVAFSVYFRQVVVGGQGNRGDFLWSIAQVVVYGLLIVTAPVLGALADYSGAKKKFLFWTTVQTVAACAALFFVRPGDVIVGFVLYVIASVGFEAGYIFYNAFLPEVSTPDTIGRVSGWSWGTGFVGGLLALVACSPLIARPLLDASGALDDGSVISYRWSFVVVAAFFAVFAVPTFLSLRERRRTAPARGLRFYVRAGFSRVADTVTHLRSYAPTARYVAGATFFSGAIETVVKFSAIYAVITFGIEGGSLQRLFVFANIVAVPGTIAAGWLADRIGSRLALVVTLVGWSGLLVVGALASSPRVFWVMTAGVAIGMGATQSIGRAFMSQLSPRGRESEFFGFYLLCNKVGAIAGLLLFGGVSAWTGSQRLAVLAVAPFFVIAVILVYGVDEASVPPEAMDEH